MANSFLCSLVTPEKAVFEEQVTYANVPAYDGLTGVMHGKSPVVLKLGHGILSLTRESGQIERFLVEGGFAQMANNRLTILSERATPVGEVTAEAAEQAMTKATALPGKTDAQFEKRQASLAGARAMRSLGGKN